MRHFVLAAALLAPAALHAQQGDGNAIAARSARVYRSLTSLSYVCATMTKLHEVDQPGG